MQILPLEHERLQARLERELQQMEQWWQRESNSETIPTANTAIVQPYARL